MNTTINCTILHKLKVGKGLCATFVFVNDIQAIKNPYFGVGGRYHDPMWIFWEKLLEGTIIKIHQMEPKRKKKKKSFKFLTWKPVIIFPVGFFLPITHSCASSCK